MRKISVGDTFKKEKEWLLSNNDNFHTRFIINQGKKNNGIRITK